MRQRAVRSYVIREGRMTAAQTRALDRLLPRFGVPERDLAAAVADFARGRALYLEIGIGNGDALLAMAAASPDACFIGSEVHRPGIGHALLGIERTGLDNVRLFPGDACDLLEALPAGALDGVFVFFPDPWPKKRHHKRRLLQRPVLTRLASRARRGATLWFATDDESYALDVRELVDGMPEWRNLAGPARWAPRCARRAATRFERRARDAGRVVFDLAAVRCSG